MKTILYIDDDPTLRQLVQFILKRKQHIVLLEAATGAAGLEIAVQEKPDLILLDLSLPDINGYEVHRRLKADAKTQDIPVIAVSGDSSPQDIARGLEAGFTGYLSKPIEVMNFYTAIDKVLG